MTFAQRQLLETLAGHLSLLKTNKPAKANSKTARACKQYVKSMLRETPTRKAA